MASTLPDSSTRPAVDPGPGVAGCVFEIFRQGLSLAGAGVGAKAEDLPVANANRAAISAAEFDCRGNQCAEHRLQIERRSADDLQHLGGRGLQLQRLRQIARARLHLVEQAHVLDRDDGLVGEGLDKRDLPVGEAARLRTRQGDHADHFAVAVHRHRERAAIVAERDGPGALWKRGSESMSSTLTTSPVKAAMPDAVVAFAAGVIANSLAAFTHSAGALRRAAGRSCSPLRSQMTPPVASHNSIAVPMSVSSTALQVERRAADDLQHVGGRGLLLQRFVEVARARLDLGFERFVALLDSLRHLVEAVGERLDLVAGANVEPLR